MKMRCFTNRQITATLYMIIVMIIASCGSDNPSNPTPSGTIRVITQTSGTDANGYSVTVLQVTKTIMANDTVLFESVSPGTYEVSLDGLDPGCNVNGTNPRTGVTVSDGNTTDVIFNIMCGTGGLFGNIEVTVITSGANGDSRYYIVVDNVDSTIVNPGTILPDTTVVIVADTVGTHQVELVDVASNCGVTNTNPQSVLIEENGTTQITFEVGCAGNLIPNGIVFVRHDPQGISQAWVCDTLGQNQTQLTFGGEDKWLPRWSPNGLEIIVNTSISNPDVHGIVLRMNDDGTNQTPVVFPSDFEPGPADWSPDGGSIAFFGHFTNPETPSSYFTYDFNTLSPPLLDNPSGFYSNYSMPFWSPDSTKLVFSINPPLPGVMVEAIMTVPVPVENGIPTPVVTDPSNNWGYLYPQWSPDGTQIVFLGPGPGRSIWIVNADGTNPHEVFDPPFGAEQPTWLHGQRIGFQQTSIVGLYTVNVDGSGLDSIGVGPNALFGQPHWNPIYH